MSKDKQKFGQFFTDRGYEIQADKDTLTPSMEDYLEMIIRISDTRGYTRVSELADNLNVKPASVSRMIKKLCNKSYLNYEKYGMIHLTEKGKKYGRYLLKRHQLLEEFFKTIGTEGDVQREVERIEHHISFENYQNLSLLVDFLKNNPSIITKFSEYKKQYKKK
ncbi:transcriptional regulator MntR [Natranaerobius trueperi]|uniref:Manganese transport regulator n=1 Tax=Natranaerobius trueperi TaxID=759412 RepID=A0A226C3L0_9FIRM|nr:transcriptional regulator MntR [Natranaerobius trueperi]OWZ85000.1 DNA-binding protein [Natranaerobius trueperi]